MLASWRASSARALAMRALRLIGPARRPMAGWLALAAGCYDATIADLGLPDGDAITLLKAARALGNRIPALILTARSAVAERVAGLSAGADDYLIEPFKVMRKSRIETSFFGMGQDYSSNAVEVSVHRLRERLERANAGVAIVTMRGGGSSFASAVADGAGIRPIEGLPAPLVSIGQIVVDRPEYFQRLGGSDQYTGVIWPSSRSSARSIIVVQNLDDPAVSFDDINTRVAVVAGLAIAALLAVLMVVDVIIVRRSLAPVAQASREIADLKPHDLTTRIATADVPIEVMPLVEGANRAFERLATAYASQRDFHADAAHALHTPLAEITPLILAITERMMRTARGELTFENRQGGGACFRLTFRDW